jgi:formamidopyrimidine-DNA glycosylase
MAQKTSKAWENLLMDRFPDSFMLPHRRRDGTCPRCHGDLKKISVAGRSGYYCPACQTKPA